jgi:GNAT superfamily N-acetyltransferase
MAAMGAQLQDPARVHVTGRPHPLRRAATSLPRHGVSGTARRTRDFVLAPLARRVYLREAHEWFRAATPSRSAPLPDGYVLRRGGERDLEALAAIGGIPPALARTYLARGARLYVATTGDELGFSAWIHEGSVPVAAAAGGEMALPHGVVSFEDSIAAPGHRRGGLSSAVIHAITALEQEAGAELIITRAAVDNEPALRWIAKVGFVPVATVRLRRILGWRRVDVEPAAGGGEAAALLAERL